MRYPFRFSRAVTVTLSFVAGCRFIYSFARDRGFPGSLNNIMAYVEPRTKVPLGSISLYLSLGIAFVCCWTNESPTVAFAAVTGCVSLRGVQRSACFA